MKTRYELIINRLLKFKKRAPGLRLGQIIWNAMSQDGKWNAPEANALYFIPDSELLTIINENFESLKKSK